MIPSCMHSSNSCSGVLELRCSRLSTRQLLFVRSFPGGGWRLRTTKGRWLRAELNQAWLVGDLAGLAWRAEDGRSYRALIRAGRQRASAWRGLRLRLRWPGS